MKQIRRYSITLVVVAAILIEVIGAAQYFMARYGARNELLAKAQRDMAESQRVAVVKTEVETAINNAERTVHLALGSPETSYSIASQIIKVNPHIIGVGLAFVPNYYKARGKEGLYLPYTYDDQPSIISKGKRTASTYMQTRVLNFDYTQRSWYQTAMQGQHKWTDAYVGEALNILMCTYSIPIKDGNGRIVGVLFADVTMEDATVMMSHMSSGIRKTGVIILLIQLFSMLLMGFIVWRAVVASRQFKERYVSPEKEQLVEKIEKMREVNNRLTKRNQELAQKVAELQHRVKLHAGLESDQHWFG